MADISKQMENLSPQKRALFELLMQERKKEKENAQLQRIPKRQPGDALPLSFAQQRLWFLEQLEPGSPAYNIPSVVRLKGNLNIKAMEQSLNEIIKRHESLCTNFSLINREPAQLIKSEANLTLQLIDFSAIPQDKQEAEVQQYITKDNQAAYDLVNGLLFRGTLLKLNSEEHILILNMHHIVSDGWSLQVLMHETAVIYEALVTSKTHSLPELAIQYPDYAIWQREWVKGDLLKKQLHYWKEQLHGSRFVLDLPTDYARPPIQGSRGSRQYIAFNPETTKNLNLLGQQNEATVFMTLLTVLYILLYKYTGQNDINVGTPIAGRNRTELEGMIGFFVNTLALRAEINDQYSFKDLLRNVCRITQGAYDHQDLPFEIVVEELQPERDLSRNPIFQVCFSYQSETMPPLSLPGLALSSMEIDSGTARFDLELQLWKEDESIKGYFEYSTDLFKHDTIARLVNHFRQLLNEVIANPEGQVGRFSVMTPEELHRLLYDWNETRVDYPAVCIHELFEMQAAKTPDAVAVYGDGAGAQPIQLTYRDLSERSNQLANYLLKAGLGPETLVGICLERSPEMLIGLLGILKAGGTYVPLDPAYPGERLAYMIGDAQLPFLLTQKALLESIPSHPEHTICLDKEWDSIHRESVAKPVCNIAPQNIAYIIYTSGSTGKPKGVAIPHRAVVNFLNSMSREPGLTDADTLLSVTTLSFDIAGLELYLPVTVGAKLVIVSRETAADGLQLIKCLDTYQVTAMQATPATWRLMIQSGWEGSKNLKVLCGGEAMPKELANQLLSRSASLWNMYGPTETTIWSATCKVESGETPISIGRPIDNTQIYILDHNLAPVPVGGAGELYIGGDGLARGYYKRPELTAERFIPNPFYKERRNSQRIYKTGDLARFLADGKIEVLGRIDHQIKLRGFRIELGEIEAVLSKHQSVREAVVALREIAAGDQRLVAYYVSKDTSLPASNDLRTHLKAELPEYMLPSFFVPLDALPLTPNGKIDRRALPAPDLFGKKDGDAYAAPAGEVEQAVASIWREVLKVEKVGVYDNFFDLGGHSLLLTQVNMKLRDIFDKDITMIDMFKYPTVKSLAEYLIKGGNEISLGAEVGRAKARREAAGKDETEVAIIGMALRLPGAKTPEEYWHNLENGVESISFFSDEEVLAAGASRELLSQPNFVKAEAIVEDVELFDAAFFGYGAKEAEAMDPQLRFLLECSWEALERAGYSPEYFQGRIGVYGGSAMSTYMLSNMTEEHDTHGVMMNYKERIALLAANSNDFTAQTISYNLKLDGPSINVQTACSSSLVATHLACQSLLRQECDMALVGTTQIRIPQKIGYLYTEGGLPSPDGHCRPFSAEANGTVHANGAGTVLLKRLQDAIQDGDNIYAVIKGSAINNDGALKIGFTAPSVDGQARVIAEAQAVANTDPGSITYVEAFGTGTELGDPLEVEALTQAFTRAGEGRAVEKQYCAIGSVKSNLGHLDHVSGMAGLIKTALALKHKKIPPSLHYEKPNPKIDFEHSPFFVNTKLRDWDTEKLPRRAGLSSFAIGGTNAHLILEESPEIGVSGRSRPWQMLMLSAKTNSALKTQTENLTDYLKKHPHINLADVAFTLQRGRKTLNYRQVILASGVDDTLNTVAKFDPGRIFNAHTQAENTEVVFMFPDEGAVSVNICSDLYRTEKVFKEHADRCFAILKSNFNTDLRAILYPDDNGATGARGQALASPAGKAATFTVEYALAGLWNSWGINPKGMIGQGVGEYVAACLSGILPLAEALKLIMTPGVALQKEALSSPKIPLVSRATGAWLTAAEAQQPGYWEENSLLKGLNLNERFNALLKRADQVLLEVGSKASLGLLAQSHPKKQQEQIILSSLGDNGEPDLKNMLTALGKCWLAGVKIDWRMYYEDEKRQSCVLPTYPFERQRYWMEKAKKDNRPAVANKVAPRNTMEQELQLIWRELLGINEIGVYDSFTELGGDTEKALQALNRIRERYFTDISLNSFLELGNIANLAEAVTKLQIENMGADELAQLLDKL